MYKNIAFLFKNKKIEDNFNFYLWLTFLVAVAIGLLNHEMWRDELEAWLIAKDSISIPEMLNNLKYTGHPALWYLCLHFISKVTTNPLVIQLFNLIVITAALFIFIYYSPFNYLQKTLFCFSYFPLYEYGIISRSYSLEMLLIFSFCALFCQKKHNYILLTIVLLLLPHTNIYGLILGFIFAAIFFWTAVAKAIYNQKDSSEWRRIGIALSLSLTTYLISLSAAIIQITPPADAKRIGRSASANSGLFQFIQSSEAVITGIWRSYVPIPNFSLENSWGTNILAENIFLPEIANIDLGSFLSAVMSLVLFAIFTVIFARNYKALFTYVAGNALIIAFNLKYKLPDIRHNGHLFILLIVCFWIFLSEAQTNYAKNRPRVLKALSSQQNLLLTIILCIQLYAGIKMYAVDLGRVFSNSQNVARYIKNNQLEQSTIVGSRYRIVFPLSAWLDRPIYYPEIRKFGTFTVWTSKSVPGNTYISQQEILQEAAKLKRENENLLLVLDKKLGNIDTSLNPKLLASYEDAIVDRENYFIYSID